MRLPRYKNLISAVLAFVLVISGGLGFYQFKHHKKTIHWTLEKFQTQTLDWKSCEGSFSCASFHVPVDYNHIDQNTFELKVLVHPANIPTQKQGVLFVNPGGPGGSGIDYAFNAESIVSPSIADVYDIVGFDPRGVNLSQPIRCLTDAQEDQVNADGGTVQTPADLAVLIKDNKLIASACAKAAGTRLGHYSTLDSAKDMDILRAILHQPKLNYIGKSYGTFMGTLYAALFPDKTGRIVLDGAVDPNLSTRDQDIVQAQGFDAAFNSFLKSNQEFTLQNIFDLLKRSRTEPLMVGTRKLTESLTITGFASALYDSQAGWPQLKKALDQAIRQKNGKPLLDLADQYNQREKDGRYSSNQNDISQIVSCLDFPHTQTIEQMQADEPNFASAAPIFGPYLAFAGISCNYWQAKPVPKPALTNLKTNPLLVIGTTRDPATPYAWAQALHKVLVNSTLITLNGDGHTGANRGSTCVDAAMNKYLLTGISPESDLYCAK